MPDPDRDTPTAKPPIVRRFIKPVEVEAAQFAGDGDNAEEIAAWAGVPYTWWAVGRDARLTLHVVEGNLSLGPYDWVVRDDGFRVVSHLWFEYEPAPEVAA